MKTLEKFLLDTIEIEDDRLNEWFAYKNVLQKAHSVAIQELWWRMEQWQNRIETVKERLLWLWCNIPFTYFDIENLLVSLWHNREKASNGDYQDKHYREACATIICNSR